MSSLVTFVTEQRGTHSEGDSQRTLSLLTNMTMMYLKFLGASLIPLYSHSPLYARPDCISLPALSCSFLSSPWHILFLCFGHFLR